MLLNASILGAMQYEKLNPIRIVKKEYPTHRQIVAESQDSGTYGYIYLPVAKAENRWLISYLFVEKNHRNKGIASYS